jgi:hypothetical protein
VRAPGRTRHEAVTGRGPTGDCRNDGKEGTMSLETLPALFQAVSTVVIASGLVAGLIQYYYAVKKQREGRKLETYNALDEKFVTFQQICLAHPELDVFDVPNDTIIEEAKRLGKDWMQFKRETIMFTLLFSIFERSFLMYTETMRESDIRKSQWTGWVDYMRDFSKRTNFTEAWKVSGSTFDKGFQKHMEAILQESSH